MSIAARPELAALTTMLIADVHAGRSLSECLVAQVSEVFLTALGDEPLTPAEAAATVCSYLQHLVESGDYSQFTVDKASQIITRLAKYVMVRDRIEDVRAIGHDEVLRFLDAPTLPGAPPEIRSWDNRRWAADTFFRVLRSLDLYDGDPLTDERRPRPPTNGAARALTDQEIASCRFRSKSSIDDLRGPVVVALGEATATTSEITRVSDDDVDVPNERVWLTTAGRGVARWGYLSEWGLPHVARLIEVRADTGERDTPLVQGVRGRSGPSQESICMALKTIMRRAGLGPDPTAKPRSFRLWAARKIYDTTGDLEEVRHRVGVKKLDDARRMLDIPWGRCDLPPDHRRSP